jgi:hypothetical protein
MVSWIGNYCAFDSDVLTCPVKLLWPEVLLAIICQLYHHSEDAMRNTPRAKEPV